MYKKFKAENERLYPYLNEEERYLMRTDRILRSITEENPDIKKIVGNMIFHHVIELAGFELAPKITGMMIVLPVKYIKQYLESYGAFKVRVNEFYQLLAEINYNNMNRSRPQLPSQISSHA